MSWVMLERMTDYIRPFPSHWKLCLMLCCHCSERILLHVAGSLVLRFLWIVGSLFVSSFLNALSIKIALQRSPGPGQPCTVIASDHALTVSRGSLLELQIRLFALAYLLVGDDIGSALTNVCDHDDVVLIQLELKLLCVGLDSCLRL